MSPSGKAGESSIGNSTSIIADAGRLGTLRSPPSKSCCWQFHEHRTPRVLANDLLNSVRTSPPHNWGQPEAFADLPTRRTESQYKGEYRWPSDRRLGPSTQKALGQKKPFEKLLLESRGNPLRSIRRSIRHGRRCLLPQSRREATQMYLELRLQTHSIIYP